MNEEIESELTKMYSRPDNLEVSEDASVDEAVPIDLRKNEAQKHTKRQWAKMLKTLTLMKLEQKFFF